MTNKRVLTGVGPVNVKIRDNGKGVIDQSAVTAFTRGDCHSFAIAMHDRTGWPIIGIGGETHTPGHFVLYDPEIDDYVDIEGPGALDRWDYLARIMIREFDRTEVLAPPVYYKNCDPELAKPFVQTVLEEVDTLPAKGSHEMASKYLNPVLNDSMW